MDLMLLKTILYFLYFALPVYGGVLWVQKREWMNVPSTGISEGDVECFSEYMELWIHKTRIEGLRLWLSAMLRIQVSLTPLESLNQQLSACGFGLHKDPDRNYIFRVTYNGCFVQLEISKSRFMLVHGCALKPKIFDCMHKWVWFKQHGNYMIVLNLMKRVSRFGGRTHNYLMKCPVVPAPPNREHIQCDPDFIQVTRQIPVDSWSNELTWSLALRGSLVVALEDASLIQVNVDIQKPLLTVQGRRNAVLTPVQVLQTEGQFLPLKLVSGHYAYSMEATCPNVIQYSEYTVLHIYKRRMGLTKRGGYDKETLSVSSVSINQTETFTWSESSSFVKLILPTALIQKTKKCSDKDSENLRLFFFRVDVMLTFKETNNKMLWTMENKSPCSEMPSATPTTFTTENIVSSPTPPYSEITDQSLFISSTDSQISAWTTENRLREKLQTSHVQTTRSAELLSEISGSPETYGIFNSTLSVYTDTVLPFVNPSEEGRSIDPLYQTDTKSGILSPR